MVDDVSWDMVEPGIAHGDLSDRQPCFRDTNGPSRNTDILRTTAVDVDHGPGGRRVLPQTTVASRDHPWSLVV